ncbi:hypothetical protein LIPSTDRAFT_72569 [Lipomyces starkeyi NRRL Y-11557]|uniref:Uncharacterized protein n=1 Tax=Lipomyces starkeyi NRRL Y-11557 TaxID=675824 RepID=A0A1E3Q2M0_LIPST|nr:hypothetical protein LIPSTDRAFT_72569 [Lipomyces starkeyi NRRL Y-11557]
MTNQDCFIRIRIRIRLMSIRIRNFLRISADISVIRVSVPIPTFRRRIKSNAIKISGSIFVVVRFSISGGNAGRLCDMASVAGYYWAERV